MDDWAERGIFSKREARAWVLMRRNGLDGEIKKHPHLGILRS
jgi:hypothetical protein